MVRFKNRHLLVEFLSPQTLSSTVTGTNPAGLSGLDPYILDNDDEDEDDDDGDGELPILPAVPFLVPTADATSRLKLGDESGSTIYRAIKQNILDVFGDEGWGRVSSSFKVIYHSPLTTLTLLRCSRAHYRTLWAALTLLRSIADQTILPRVVGISGTIKKLQNRAIAYHRVVVAQMLAVRLEGMDRGDMIARKEAERGLRKEAEGEETAMGACQD